MKRPIGGFRRLNPPLLSQINMASLDIKTLRGQYPHLDDSDAAREYGVANNCIAIVRYRTKSSTSDYTNVGLCQSEEELSGYLQSPYCIDVEIIYDGRQKSPEADPCEVAFRQLLTTIHQGVLQSILQREDCDAARNLNNALDSGPKTIEHANKVVLRYASRRMKAHFRQAAEAFARCENPAVATHAARIVEQCTVRWWQFWK